MIERNTKCFLCVSLKEMDARLTVKVCCTAVRNKFIVPEGSREELVLQDLPFLIGHPTSTSGPSMKMTAIYIEDVLVGYSRQHHECLVSFHIKAMK